jgi:1-acyl-sn-glycerol-3-phosphate acyltransferase
MQKVIIDEPYRFVKPERGTFWLKFFELYVPRYLRKSHGISKWETKGTERLQRSIKAGHSIMLAPNHCRPCDPMILGMICKQMKKPSYMMASWHLFKQGDFYAKILPKVGVFSIYREGVDRESLKFAINSLAEAERMLILFPEGIITRTNNHVHQMLEGTSFIARSAAKKRLSSEKGGKTVIHPVAIRYFFEGDIEKTVSPVLDRIERSLTWQTTPEKSLIERIEKIGHALLDLKEIEYFGSHQVGSFDERLEKPDSKNT